MERLYCFEFAEGLAGEKAIEFPYAVKPAAVALALQEKTSIIKHRSEL